MFEMGRGERGEENKELARLTAKFDSGSARPEEVLELAERLLRGKNTKKGENVLMQLIAAPESDEHMIQEACELLEDVGSYEVALDGYRKISEMNSRRALPVYRMGRLLEMQGRIEEAIRLHKQAIALEEDNPECYYRLGVAYTKNHQYEEAETQYGKAISIDPTHSKSYTNLGYILDLQGKRESAFLQFRKAGNNLLKTIVMV